MEACRVSVLYSTSCLGACTRKFCFDGLKLKCLELSGVLWQFRLGTSWKRVVPFLAGPMGPHTPRQTTEVPKLIPGMFFRK